MKTPTPKDQTARELVKLYDEYLRVCTIGGAGNLSSFMDFLHNRQTEDVWVEDPDLPYCQHCCPNKYSHLMPIKPYPVAGCVCPCHAQGSDLVAEDSKSSESVANPPSDEELKRKIMDITQGIHYCNKYPCRYCFRIDKANTQLLDLMKGNK